MVAASGAAAYDVTERDVVLETGTTRSFASMLYWPGWCRAGRTEEAALAELIRYAPRYAQVTTLAGLSLGDLVAAPQRLAAELRVVQRLAGNATTDFGAPGQIADAEREPLPAPSAARLADLVAAAWAVLQDVAAVAPAQLRKGPRGGGRDRDAIVGHVMNAERAYARKIGLKLPEPPDPAEVAAGREAILVTLRSCQPGPHPLASGWPLAYAARRIAWHVLDHAWEIEDRAGPGQPEGPGRS